MCVLWASVGLFIWEDIAMAPKSLGAHKCDVFVKRQKVQRKKRAWKHKETKAKRKKNDFNATWKTQMLCSHVDNSE